MLKSESEEVDIETSKPKRKRKFNRLLLLLGLGLLLAVAIIVLSNLHTQTVNSPAAYSNNTSLKPEKSKPVMLTLPGADPVLALKEDYDSDTSLWHIVSKDHPLNNPHYVPGSLILATINSRTDKSTLERSLRSDIMPAVEALFSGLKSRGYEMMIGSGYRSYEQQTIYYTNYVKTYGQARADTFSAQPGKSEHQTGLAFDISYSNRECYLDECFGDMPAGKWLAEHSFEYGFILRYPKDKTEITRYIYEPWHFRYVGKDLAKALHDSGLTLDEARPYLYEALGKLKDAKEI